jgi:hypothetical protein
MRRRIPRAGRRLLVHVDENLAEATAGIISGSEVDLLTTDARLLGVAIAPVGEALARIVGVAGAAGRGGSREEGGSNSVPIGAPCPNSAVATQAAGDLT